MKSLQLWLAILGGLVLAAVVGHGAWQTRRAAGGKGRATPPLPADTPPDSTVSTLQMPLASAQPQEPSFDAETAPATEPMPLETARPVAEEAAAVQERLTQVPPALIQPPRRVVPLLQLDEQIDAIAQIVPEQVLSGEVVLAHLPASRRAGGKPFVVEARDQRSRLWGPPQIGQGYLELRAGLQMVNRSGPVNEIEYSEFVQKVQAYADTLGASVEFPDMLEVVSQGRALDRIVVHHDAQLAMRLKPRQGNWPVSWVQQHAARHGFVNGPVPGRLILPGEDELAPPVLALLYDAQAALADDPNTVWVSQMSLVFDVPQTPQSQQAFNAWCAAGQAMALALDAELTDDDGQPLTTESFTMIREDLDNLYAKLIEFKMPAGSAIARRLFS